MTPLIPGESMLRNYDARPAEQAVGHRRAEWKAVDSSSGRSAEKFCFFSLIPANVAKFQTIPKRNFDL